MELIDLALDLIQRAGPTGLLLLFIWLLMTGRLVWRRELDRAEGETKNAKADADEWKLMAMRGTDLAEFLGKKATGP